MFFWKKKKEEALDLSWLHTDFHSHLIPGIDDGAPDTETSLKLIKGLVDLGYKKLITTPHILSDVYPNTREKIMAGFTALQKVVKKENLPVELGAAAEYFIDDTFEERLRNKEALLTISDNKVLVEFSMITAPFDLNNILFEIQIQNYQPVIAHPERYIYLSPKKSVFDDLKNSGCLFQLNLLSLSGYYGTAVQDLAEYLLKKNYYDFACTDLHSSKHLAALQKLSSSSYYQKLKEEGNLQNHLL